MLLRLSGILLAAMVVLGGCSAKPSAEDLKVLVQQNMPDALRSVATVDQLQAEVAAGGEEMLVKFKAQLKLTQSLYSPVGFGQAANAAGADLTQFGALQQAVNALSSERRKPYEADVSRLTTKPVFLDEVHASGAPTEWYGSFKTRKVVDKWVVSEFRTDVHPEIKGQPRSAYPDASVLLASSKDWFSEVQREQQSLAARLSELRTLEQTEAQLAQAQAAAQQEREARATVVAAAEKQSRQLPVRVALRPAVLGGTLVLHMQALSAMTIRLDVVRGLQRFSRDLQLRPGTTTSFGHLEGWGFRVGDEVRLTNPAFDPFSFAVR